MSPKKKVTQKKANQKKKAVNKAKPKAASKSTGKSTKKVTKGSTKKTPAITKKATKKVAKAPTKKAAKKTPKPTTKKVAKKKTPAKTTEPKKKTKQPRGGKSKDMHGDYEEKESIVLGARKRKATPTIFKIRARKQTPIVFTLEDVQAIVKKKSTEKSSPTSKKEAPSSQAKKMPARKITEEKHQTRKLGAASIADILGFNPADKKSKPKNVIDESSIPSKWLKYYKVLTKLRDHVQEGLDFHAQDTLKRSSKDDAGDLSSYSQHMADAGTDTFDRDFALSMVSSDQDALYEIDEAIQRILNGTYGICEITGKPIPAARLMAVPFTRCSLEGQKQIEATKKTSQRERGGVFSESSLEESVKYTEEDSDN